MFLCFISYQIIQSRQLSYTINSYIMHVNFADLDKKSICYLYSLFFMNIDRTEILLRMFLLFDIRI